VLPETVLSLSLPHDRKVNLLMTVAILPTFTRRKVEVEKHAKAIREGRNED